MDSNENNVSPASDGVKSKRQLKRMRHTANRKKKKVAEDAGVSDGANEPIETRRKELELIQLELQIAKAELDRVEMGLEAAVRQEKLMLDLRNAEEGSSEVGTSPPTLEESSVEGHLQALSDRKRKEIGWLAYEIGVRSVDRWRAKLGGLACGAVLATAVGRKLGFWSGIGTLAGLTGAVLLQPQEIDVKEACLSVDGSYPELVGYLIMRYPDNTRRDNLSALTLASKQWCSQHVDWDHVSMAEAVAKSIMAYQLITTYRGLGNTKNELAPLQSNAFAHKAPILESLDLIVKSALSPVTMTGDVIRSLYGSVGSRSTVVGLVSLTAIVYITRSTGSWTGFFVRGAKLIRWLIKVSYEQQEILAEGWGTSRLIPTRI
jgi:DNA-binding XRE family transcriptional regulator